MWSPLSSISLCDFRYWKKITDTSIKCHVSALNWVDIQRYWSNGEILSLEFGWKWKWSYDCLFWRCAELMNIVTVKQTYFLMSDLFLYNLIKSVCRLLANNTVNIRDYRHGVNWTTSDTNNQTLYADVNSKTSSKLTKKLESGPWIEII